MSWEDKLSLVWLGRIGVKPEGRPFGLALQEHSGVYHLVYLVAEKIEHLSCVGSMIANRTSSSICLRLL